METSFEWNEQKNQENQTKHDVSFEEAQDAFSDPNKRLITDLEHSQVEERWFCLGKITVIRNGELFEGIVTVRFTYRNKKIRIIGAGFWRKGEARYAEKRN